MAGSYLAAFVTAATLLSSLPRAALGQTVVDNSRCEEYGIHCPKPGEPSYKKYCCVESNLYSCCNPYFGLIIGVSVGIPIIVLIIVAVVLTYCVCRHYHNHKRRSVMAVYYRLREEMARRREVELLAPPPYSVAGGDGEGGDTELPTYSETDPYKDDTPLIVNDADGEGGGGEDVERVTPARLETVSVEVEEERGLVGTDQTTSD